MAGVIEREDGTRIHGPGKLSAERLQHELALRRRANRIPGRVTTTERAVAANNAAQPRRRGDGHAPSQFRLGNRKPRRLRCPHVVHYTCMVAAAPAVVTIARVPSRLPLAARP